MNVYELTAALGGEIVRNRARYRTPDGYVLLGKLNGDAMEFTEEGRALAAAQEAEASVTREVQRAAKKPARQKTAESLSVDEFEIGG